ENSVDIITVASAVHWFDLEKFYPIVKRVLRKPGGIFAVWCYSRFKFSPEIDILLAIHFERTFPFQNPNFKHALECYKTLPFPFESVGVGCEGQPLELDMEKKTSFQGRLKFFRSFSAFNTAKGQGVDLLSDEVVQELESAWGGPEVVRTVIYKTYMLAGKVKL
ncbi:methyltransferase, partial [Populus alba x Populus x berolinensis]